MIDDKDCCAVIYHIWSVSSGEEKYVIIDSPFVCKLNQIRRYLCMGHIRYSRQIEGVQS